MGVMAAGLVEPPFREVAALPALVPDALHVWRMTTDRVLAGRAEGILSDSERVRAGRMRDEDTRETFVAAHAVLRVLLAGYLGCAPRDVVIEAGAHGKPRLAHAMPGGPLHFNLSHSGGLVVVAFSRTAEVGVDTELIRERADWRGVGRRFFAAGEVRAIKAAEGEGRLALFHALWCAKEALLKTTGGGLASGLERTEVFWDGTPTPRFEVRSEDTGAWCLRCFVPGPGYLAACAVKRRPTCWEFYDVPGAALLRTLVAWGEDEDLTGRSD